MISESIITSGKTYGDGLVAVSFPNSSHVPHFGISFTHVPIYSCPESRK